MKPIAPATYVFDQDDFQGGKIRMFNLNQDIPGHPKNSTVSEETLVNLGYVVEGK